MKLLLCFKVNIREEDAVLPWQIPRGLCCSRHVEWDGTPGLLGSAVPESLLANRCLGTMNRHHFNRSINGGCFILNRKLNELLLLHFIIYVI